MKVKYTISVSAPKFGQELFDGMLSAFLGEFNQRKTYRATIIDHEIAPKYMRKDRFENVMQKDIPEYLRNSL